jgi:hypothetical protein
MPVNLENSAAAASNPAIFPPSGSGTFVSALRLHKSGQSEPILNPKTAVDLAPCGHEGDSVGFPTAAHFTLAGENPLLSNRLQTQKLDLGLVANCRFWVEVSCTPGAKRTPGALLRRSAGKSRAFAGTAAIPPNEL